MAIDLIDLAARVRLITFGKMRSLRLGVEIMSTCSLPTTSCWQLCFPAPSSTASSLSV